MGPQVPEPLRGSRAGLVRLLLMQARWGSPGSRGWLCLTTPSPQCVPHALPDQETLNKPMFEMCFSKYLLSKSFRTQASIAGPRMEPTAGKGPSPQTLLVPTGKRAHTPGHCWGPRPRGMARGGPPWRSLGAGHCDHTVGGGVPRPQEATLGEVALPPPPCPLDVPQEHLPVDAAPSQSVGLNLHPEVEYLLVFTSGDACPLN